MGTLSSAHWKPRALVDNDFVHAVSTYGNAPISSRALPAADFANTPPLRWVSYASKPPIAPSSRMMPNTHGQHDRELDFVFFCDFSWVFCVHKMNWISIWNVHQMRECYIWCEKLIEIELFKKFKIKIRNYLFHSFGLFVFILVVTASHVLCFVIFFGC